MALTDAIALFGNIPLGWYVVPGLRRGYRDDAVLVKIDFVREDVSDVAVSAVLASLSSGLSSHPVWWLNVAPGMRDWRRLSVVTIYPWV